MIRRRKKLKSAVVDTNLFISGTINKRGNPYLLLQYWREGLFLLIISREQRRELEEVLGREKISQDYGIGQTEIKSILRRVDRKAVLVQPTLILPVVIRDPKDEKILATALGGEADYLVTGDEDLLVLNGYSFLGKLRILRAREFLDLLDA